MKDENMKKTVVLVCSIGLFLLLAEPSHAKTLAQASVDATTTAKTIAQALSSLGVVAGGVIMQIPGASDFGRRTLQAGLVGCLCSFGGPALITLLTTIFGV